MINKEITFGKVKKEYCGGVYHEVGIGALGYSLALEAMDEYAKEVAIEFLKYWQYGCVGYDKDERDEKLFNETFEEFKQENNIK